MRANGLDVGITGNSTAFARVVDRNGVAVVEQLAEFRPPKGQRVDLVEVEEEIFALSQQFGGPWYYDPYQAQLLAQRLRRRGVRMIEFVFTADSRRKLFATFLDVINTGRFKCSRFTAHAAELRRQLRSLEVKRLPSGGWRIDHRQHSRDDLVVACALAVQGLPRLMYKKTEPLPPSPGLSIDDDIPPVPVELRAGVHDAQEATFINELWHWR